MTASRVVLMVTLGLALLAAPLAAEAQPAGKVWRIGILANLPLTGPGASGAWGTLIQGLRELGYVEGQNIARWEHYGTVDPQP